MTDVFYTSSRKYVFLKKLAFFFKKEESAEKPGLVLSTWIAIKVIFSFILIATKLNCKHKFKLNKIRNGKVGNFVFLTLHN